MTNRLLLPLYLGLFSLPGFAADSGGVETWSPVIRPGAPNKPAKIDEQEKRRAESKLQQLSAEKGLLAEENQRLKARLEMALEPKASKDKEKSPPAGTAQSQEGSKAYPSEIEDVLRRHHALKDKDYAAYLTPPIPLFSDGFYLAYGPFKEKPTCLDYFSEGKNVYPLQLKVKPPGENEYYCYYPYLWSSKSQTFANWRRGPETVLLQMSREGTVPIKNW